MTFNSNEEPNNNSAWNPFLPTNRDIERTEELASKNPVIAGLLTFLMLPLGMLYLNRGINGLKILGYTFLAAFIVGAANYNKSDEELEAMSNSIGVMGSIAAIAESTRAVTLARKRQSENNF